MAPSFAELKAKAVKAKDVSVSKIQSTRDRNTSVPMKNTNWDPYSGQPAPPPPPPRVNPNSRPAAQHSFPPPPQAPNRPAVVPPPSRTPSLPSRSSPAHSVSPSPVPPAPAPRPPPRTFASSSSSVSSGGPPPIVRSTRPDSVEPTIDWTNLSAQDKEAFFSWLDEYFSRALNVDIPPR